MISIVQNNSKFNKIPGIFHDTSPENEEKAKEFLHFLISHGDIESGPRDSFTMAIFRDSIVSAFLVDGQSTMEEIILQKAPYLRDYPEQLENLLAVSTNDLQATLKNRS